MNLDVHSYAVAAPYHMEWAPAKSDYSGQYLMSGDIPRLIDGMLQAVDLHEVILHAPIAGEMKRSAVAAGFDFSSARRALQCVTPKHLGPPATPAASVYHFHIPPVLILIVLSALRGTIDPVFAPAFVPSMAIIGLAADYIEEIGWMGCAFEQMKTGRSALPAALTLGLIWSLWHFAAAFIGNSTGALGVI
jgi:hypothetical protein